MHCWQCPRMAELLNALISGSVVLARRRSTRAVPRLGNVMARLARERPVNAASRARAGALRVMSWCSIIPAWMFVAMGSPTARNSMVGRVKLLASARRNT